MDYRTMKELALQFRRMGYGEYETNFYFKLGLEGILMLFPNILDGLKE